MSTRVPTLLAVLSIGAIMVWIVDQAPPVTGAGSGLPQAAVAMESAASGATDHRIGTPPTAQERSPGSEAPCAVPLAWRIARVDPEFGFDAEEATGIVAEAARLWEEGTGRRLFEHDPVAGFPVRLVYDERQGVLAERQRRLNALDELLAQLDQERDDLTSSSQRLSEATNEHVERAADLERRVSEHNATIREWNRAGAPPEEVRLELEAVGVALQEEQTRLAAERQVLRERQASLERAEIDLNRRVLEHEALASELAAAFPPSEVEAGEYREAVRRENGELVSVSREIRLYRFATADELRLVAAHELGHALGLGHTEDELGIMSARARSDRPVRELAGTDAALLETVCPAPTSRR